MIRTSTLFSGSKANSTFVQVDNKCILLDAGGSYKGIAQALAKIGKRLGSISEIYQCHAHKDHCAAIPAILKKHRRIQVFKDGAESKDGDIKSFLLSHDEPNHGYTVTDEAGNKLVYSMDSGCMPEESMPALWDAGIIITEFNYDTELLLASSYPDTLKERIASDLGHMSNEKAREILECVTSNSLKHVVCCHLSGTNNNPALVAYEAGKGAGDGVEVVIAGVEPTKMITLI